PISCITAIARGVTRPAGWMPAEKTSYRSPYFARRQPSAICERAAFAVQIKRMRALSPMGAATPETPPAEAPAAPVASTAATWRHEGEKRDKCIAHGDSPHRDTGVLDVNIERFHCLFHVFTYAKRRAIHQPLSPHREIFRRVFLYHSHIRKESGK